MLAKLALNHSHLLSIALRNTMTKSNLKNNLFGLHFWGHVHLREVRARTWSRNPGGALLSGLFTDSCLASFLMQLRTNCQGNGAAYSRRGFSIPPSRQSPHRHATGQSDWANSSTETSLFRWLFFVKSTKLSRTNSWIQVILCLSLPID